MTISKSLVRMLNACRTQIKKHLNYAVINSDEIFSIRHADFVITQDFLGQELCSFEDFMRPPQYADDESVVKFLKEFHDELETGTINCPNPNKVLIDGIGDVTIRLYENHSASLAFQNRVLTIYDGKSEPTNQYQTLIRKHLAELI